MHVTPAVAMLDHLIAQEADVLGFGFCATSRNAFD